MAPWIDMTNNQAWRDRAVAFVARARQEMWGKHNEEIVAWLFTKGFRNRFAQDMFLGWNKRTKERESSHWGFEPDFTGPHAKPGHLFFPQGVIIPYVVDTSLRKMTIAGTTDPWDYPPYRIPGSSPEPMVFGGDHSRVALFRNPVHGLLVHQELGDRLTVVIQDTDGGPEQIETLEPVMRADSITVFSDPSLGTPVMPASVKGRVLETVFEGVDALPQRLTEHV